MRTGNFRRVATLAIGSAVAALVTGVVALAVNHATLQSNDLARRAPFLNVFIDPFVLIVWIPFTFIPGLVGFAFSLWALWNVKLSKAFPVTLAATVIAAALAAVRYMPLSPVAGLLAAILVMGCCRYYEPWSLSVREARPAGPGAA